MDITFRPCCYTSATHVGGDSKLFGDDKHFLSCNTSTLDVEGQELPAELSAWHAIPLDASSPNSILKWLSLALASAAELGNSCHLSNEERNVMLPSCSSDKCEMPCECCR